MLATYSTCARCGAGVGHHVSKATLLPSQHSRRLRPVTQPARRQIVRCGGFQHWVQHFLGIKGLEKNIAILVERSGRSFEALVRQAVERARGFEYAKSTLLYSISSVLDLLSSHLSSPYARAMWVQDSSPVLVRHVAQVGKAGYHERPHTKLLPNIIAKLARPCRWLSVLHQSDTAALLVAACDIFKLVVLLVARLTKENPGGELTAQSAAAKAAASAWCSTPNADTVDTLQQVRP